MTELYKNTHNYTNLSGENTPEHTWTHLNAGGTWRNVLSDVQVSEIRSFAVASVLPASVENSLKRNE